MLSKLTAAAIVLLLGCSWEDGSNARRPVSGAPTASVANAAIVVMDVASGRVLQRSGILGSESTPGSVLKPFVLLTALRSGVVREHEAIACRGTLTVGGHNLACSHPRDVTVLDARQALAESCNTYFATVAERMPSATLMNGLRAYGIQAAKEPRDGTERALLAVGLQDVMISPLQLAQAYRKLAQQTNASPGEEVKVVEDGLRASVQTGMANAARAQEVALGGKTGTVDDRGGRSHGWFAGIVFSGADASRADSVVVVYVPNGNGADAASIAGFTVRGKSVR